MALGKLACATQMASHLCLDFIAGFCSMR